MIGSFIVGIYGATNAFYTLIIKTDIKWPVRLLNGVAVNGKVDDVDYYYFEN